ncbi:MAG: hypothetical protein LVR00_09265 [Rhabdochlamydiaceae bacterium]|jgi:carboxyl-terminal processing protease
MKKRLIFLFTLIFAQLVASSAHLKKSDIRNNLEEMFTYHVEYKELTPLLVKRSFKSYLDHFDSQRVYFLQSEVDKYFELTSTDIERIIDNYSMDCFTDYELLNEKIGVAIERARAYRQELMKELITASITPALSTDSFAYAESVDQIKKKIKNQMIRFLQAEKKADAPAYWTVERRGKY